MLVFYMPPSACNWRVASVTGAQPGGVEAGACLRDVSACVYHGLEVGLWNRRWVRGIVYKPSYLLFFWRLISPSLHGRRSAISLTRRGIACTGVSQDGQHVEGHKLHCRAGRSAAQHA